VTGQGARERFTVERIAFRDRKKGMLACDLVWRANERCHPMAAVQRKIDNLVASAPSGTQHEHAEGVHCGLAMTKKYLYEIEWIARNNQESSA